MAAVEITLRGAAQTDLPALAELEKTAFETSNWPADIFLRYDCMVAEVNGRMVGFIVSREVFAGSDTDLPEREILNLAVAPDFRRSGVASLLLQAEFRHPAHFLLEVRESNLAARALYERHGFAEISRRRQYYDNPPETAIVMRRK